MPRIVPLNAPTQIYSLVCKILFSQYSELILRGFKISEEKIITDVNKLLSKNALDFIT